jgi:hypothetical protein
MTTIASITMSLDGFITGPDDRPGQGLGVGGERLHYWVFGGPWTYDDEPDFGAMSGEDKVYYDGLIERIGRASSAAGCTRPLAPGAGRTPSPARWSC